MFVTAEIRWFWHSEPRTLKSWFLSPAAHNGIAISEEQNESRQDCYLLDPNQPQLGIKKRGNQDFEVEIKGLVDSCWCHFYIGDLSCPVELWSKWTSAALPLDPRSFIILKKNRWLRVFDTQHQAVEIEVRAPGKLSRAANSKNVGCNVELTRVAVGEDDQDMDVWWTLGFEAFGPIRSLEHSLTAVKTELVGRDFRIEPGAILASYPLWLSQYQIEARRRV